jgi:hypothetical protein
MSGSGAANGMERFDSGRRKWAGQILQGSPETAALIFNSARRELDAFKTNEHKVRSLDDWVDIAKVSPAKGAPARTITSRRCTLVAFAVLLRHGDGPGSAVHLQGSSRAVSSRLIRRLGVQFATRFDGSTVNLLAPYPTDSRCAGAGPELIKRDGNSHLAARAG